MPEDLLQHLSPETKLILEKSVEEKVNWVSRARWIAYPEATAAINRLEDMLTHPQQHRMPGLRIISESNNGKSHLIEEFSVRHPPNDNYGADNIICPVLIVETPPAPREADIYRQILTTLFRKVPSSPGAMRDDAIAILKAIQVKVLIFDELSNMASLQEVKQRQSLDTIKFIANSLEACVVGVGTKDLDRVLLGDPQVENRLRPIELPRWTQGQRSRALMMSLEMLLPFPESSKLSNSAMTNFVLGKTGGLIGEICELLTTAAKYALRKGLPKIDESVLIACGYIPPGR